MKKSLPLLLSLLFGGLLFAAPVSPERARQVAYQFCQLAGPKYIIQDPSDLMDVSAKMPFTTFYTFQLGETGFMMVSADDCVVPVLGYSFDRPVRFDNMPDQIVSWLRSYEEQIVFLRDNGVEPSPEVSAQWKNLESGICYAATLPSSVSPLVATTWDQNPYYNSLCPGTGSGANRAVTGCVATAMAQVMKYWNHPASGRGSHTYTDDHYGNQSADFGSTTYQWSNMPNSLSGASNENQINAVATLMFHVGVAVEMDYGTESAGGSGANTISYGYASIPSAEQALVNYFRYQPTLCGVVMADYTDAQWSSMLRSDLDEGRPIIYRGDDLNGGHCFICDGYDNAGRFHFNWGWGGSFDGFFAIGSLNLSGGGAGSTSSYTFNLDNGAILGIAPMTSTAGNTTISASASSSSYGSVSGTGTFTNFTDTISLVAKANTGYRFEHWSDGCKYNPRQFVAPGGSYSFRAEYASIAGDTITYCTGPARERLGIGSTSYWGIGIPSSSLVSGSSLHAVRVYTSSRGSYTVTIYKGSSRPTTQLHTQTFTSNANDSWQTFTLSSPVAVDASQSLYVTVSSSVSYPMTTTFYCGNADGSWVKYGSSWMKLSEAGNLCTWMIDAIFTTGSGGGGSSSSDCVVTSFPWNEGFEGDMDCWTAIDADGDGSNWMRHGETSYVHSGSAGMFSESWTQAAGAFRANNYLVSPKIQLPSGSNCNLTFYARSMNSNYPDTLEVLVTTGAGESASEFVTLVPAAPIVPATMTLYSASLSNYRGQTVRIAFRHHSYDGHYVFLDDVSVAVTQAIADTSAPVSYRLWAEGHSIVVSGAAGSQVSVFDVLGRRIASSQTAAVTERIAVPQSGVYFISVDGSAARRVVVL